MREAGATGANGDGMAGLLRWYPPAWRDRYGDEFAVAMADSLDGGRPTPRFRLRIAWAGLRERGYAAGLVGDGSPPSRRVRAGALLVLCAWTAFVLATASYAKLSEHFTGFLSSGSSSLPTDAYDVLRIVSGLGAAAVGVGVLVAGPSLLRFLSGGGWPKIRRVVLVAAALTVVAVVGTVALAAAADHLNAVQGNGSSDWYSAVFAWWAALGVTALAGWTVAAVAAVHRMELSGRTLAIEAGLAVTLAVAMLTMTVATAVWWAAMAKDAPGSLQGAGFGPANPAFDVRLLMTLGLMAASVVAAGYGVVVIVRAGSGVIRANKGTTTS